MALPIPSRSASVVPTDGSSASGRSPLKKMMFSAEMPDSISWSTARFASERAANMPTTVCIRVPPLWRFLDATLARDVSEELTFTEGLHEYFCLGKRRMYSTEAAAAQLR
jgi:hypothetical protein